MATKPHSYPTLNNKKDSRSLINNEQNFKEKFIIWIENDGYYAYNSYKDCKQDYHYSGKEFCIHEVILGNCQQKLKIDIDCEKAKYPNQFANFDKILGDIIAALDKTLREAYNKCLIWAIAESSDEYKKSVHMNTTMFVANNREAQEFTRRFLENASKEAIEIIDAGVNKSTQNFRMIGSTKIDKAKDGLPERSRILKPLRWSYQYTDPEDLWLNKKITKSDFIISDTTMRFKKDLCLPRLLNDRNPEEEDQNIILSADGNKIEEIITKFEATGIWKHRKIRGNYIAFDRKKHKHTYCDICKDDEEGHDGVGMFVKIYNTIILQGCFSKKAIGKPKKTLEVLGSCKQFVDTNRKFNLADYVATVKLMPFIDTPKFDKIREPTMVDAKLRREDVDSRDIDPAIVEFLGINTIMIRSHMGSGKTKALRDYLERNPQLPAIMISFRRTFSAEVALKLNLANYNKIKETDIRLRKYPRLVIQYESLHRLDPQEIYEMKPLIILDESESVLSQIMHEHAKPEECWSCLNEIIKNKEINILAMDAFLNNRTINLLRSRIETSKLVVNNYKNPLPLKDYIYKSKIALFAAMKKATAPLVFCSNSKEEADNAAEMFREILKDKLVAEPWLVQLYTAETEMKEPAELLKDWARAQYLVYSPTISAGISFELPHFNSVWSYFKQGSADYLQCIQMMNRVRDVSTKEYHYFLDYKYLDIPTRRGEIMAKLGWQARIGDVADFFKKIKRPAYEINKEIKRVQFIPGEYLDMFMDNLVFRAESEKYFRYKFLQIRKFIGAEIVVVNDLSDEEKAAKKKELKQISCDIVTKRARKIAEADAPLMEDREDDYVPEDVKMARIQDRIWKYYDKPDIGNLSIEKKTEFFLIYEKNTPWNMYQNVKKFADKGDYEWIKNIDIEIDKHDTVFQLTFANSAASMCKRLFIRNIAESLYPDIWLPEVYTGILVAEVKIAKDVFNERLKALSNYIGKNLNMLKLLFTGKITLNGILRYDIQIINNLISDIGLHFKVGNGRNNGNIYLSSSAEFNSLFTMILNRENGTFKISPKIT